jgi:hypothetical protein
MWKLAIASLLALATISAADTGALTVTVKDKSGQDLKDVSVWLEPTRLQVSFNAAHGYYFYEKLNPDSYTVAAYSTSRALKLIKVVTVNASVTSTVDFVFPDPSSISGKVVDEDRNPLVGIWVALLAGTYRGGSLAYNVALPAVKTDATGAYHFEKGIQPGRAHRIAAYAGSSNSTENAADPSEHASVLAPAYYPHARSLEAASPVVAQVAEAREHVDIVMSRADSYCVAGTVESSDVDVPGAGLIVRAEAPIEFGLWRIAAGKFRLCSVPPGEYRLMAQGGTVSVAIRSQDVMDVKLRLAGSQPLVLETVWAGDPPDPPISLTVPVAIDNSPRLIDMPLPGRTVLSERGNGEFAFSARPPKGFYVKSLTANGIDALHRSAEIIPGVTTTVRIAIAGDGGFVNVNVLTSDDKPVASSNIHIFPADETSPAILADTRIAGLSSAAGAYSSTTLAPGRYYVLATSSDIDNTPERTALLWEARKKAATVEVKPGASATIRVEPMTIE